MNHVYISEDLTGRVGQQLNVNEGKLSISIDFGKYSFKSFAKSKLNRIYILIGTTFSGVAYGSSRIASGKVQQILHWPGSFETFRKIPTCLLYDEQGRVMAWGLEAKNASTVMGGYKCEW